MAFDRGFSNGAKGEPFIAYLSQNGAGSTFNANGTYSSGSPAYWEFRPGSGQFVIARILIIIGDTGNFSAGGYGAGSALTNGICIHKTKSGTGGSATYSYSFVMSGANNIKKNEDWASIAFDTRYDTFGAGDNYLITRLTFSKFSAGVYINGDEGEALRIILQDDLSGLNEHRFCIQGTTNHLDRGFGPIEDLFP